MKEYQNYYLVRSGDRVFWVPFLLGGLGGAAVVGLSRPRPVYVNSVPNYGYQGGPYQYPYSGGYGYANSNYNYYY
jgi:hypothetical protein